MNKNKLVIPGEHLLSCEEAEPGQNTFTENDEIFSASFGDEKLVGGIVSVTRKGKNLLRPYVGMEVYCLIVKTTPNKAIAECLPVSEAEGKERSVEITAVLPVTGIRKGYVDSIRDEVKIGDIIKAKISKITKTGVDISIFPPQYGLIACFCPRCRTRMDVKDKIFICSNCDWKERRKIPR
jgi:exosome complex component CSL4